jgi:hypothetical protein
MTGSRAEVETGGSGRKRAQRSDRMIVGGQINIVFSDLEEDMLFLYTNTIESSAKKGSNILSLASVDRDRV